MKKAKKFFNKKLKINEFTFFIFHKILNKNQVKTSETIRLKIDFENSRHF